MRKKIWESTDEESTSILMSIDEIAQTWSGEIKPEDKYIWGPSKETKKRPPKTW